MSGGNSKVRPGKVQATRRLTKTGLLRLSGKLSSMLMLLGTRSLELLYLPLGNTSTEESRMEISSRRSRTPTSQMR